MSAGFAMVSEDHLGAAARGYLALGALSSIIAECDNHARGNRSWDGAVNIPAEGLGALIMCVKTQFDGLHSAGAQQFTNQEASK